MKLGDQVTVVAKYLPSCSMQGTIINVEEETLLPYTVEFDLDGFIDHNYFQEDELELVS